MCGKIWVLGVVDERDGACCREILGVGVGWWRGFGGWCGGGEGEEGGVVDEESKVGHLGGETWELRGDGTGCGWAGDDGGVG